MGRFDVADGEVVVMFRYGDQVVATRGPLRQITVSRSPIEIPSPDMYPRYMAGETEIQLDMLGRHIVTVTDEGPDWEAEVKTLPAPRLP